MSLVHVCDVMYHWLAFSQGEKDWAKYETARKLKSCVDRIQTQYKKDLHSKEMRVRQRLVGHLCSPFFVDCKDEHNLRLNIGCVLGREKLGIGLIMCLIDCLLYMKGCCLVLHWQTGVEGWQREGCRWKCRYCWLLLTSGGAHQWVSREASLWCTSQCIVCVWKMIHHFFAWPGSSPWGAGWQERCCGVWLSRKGLHSLLQLCAGE